MNKIFTCFFLMGLLVANLSFAQLSYEFTHFNVANTPIFNGNNFKAVAVNAQGTIWAGSQYHGFVRYNPSLNTWGTSIELRDVLFTDIKSDGADGIWMAQTGRSGLQGGGSNIGGGVNRFPTNSISGMEFFTITGTGGLTSRNVRSIWVDKNNFNANGLARVWLAQGTFISSSTTQAGGISVGLNTGGNSFTKIFQGLQVTPNVAPAQAGTPRCMAVAGNSSEVWVFAAANFGRSQLLRYNPQSLAFLGFFDYTNTPALSAGFMANALFFDNQNRGWIGLSSGGIIVKDGENWISMNEGSIFPFGTTVQPNAITQDLAGNVYIGTSSGLVIYRGGSITNPASYQRVTVDDGLPTNMITGIAEDTIGKRIVLAHNAGISFMTPSKKIVAELEWDFSFPKLSIKPKGVAADGVSRLFVKVGKGSEVNQPIKKMFLTIQNAATELSSMLGKLKIATEIEGYSNEANEGTSMEVSRTDTMPDGNFYFWYVAPEDFATSPASAEAAMAERDDSIKVKVTYADDTEDSTYVAVKVRRPPLVIASMLDNAKELVSKLKFPDNSTVMQSTRFTNKISLQMNQIGEAIKNVSQLIDGDLMENADKANSLQGIIEKMRSEGFASNKVDFVGHGLSGSVMRMVASVKKAKFFADGDQTYNNYGEGFVNKLVTINTPHNNTPLFSFINEFTPKLSELSQKILNGLIKENPDSLLPYKFLTADDTTVQVAGELVRKALMGIDGLNLPETNIKNHLIVSNIGASPENAAPKKLYGLYGNITHQLSLAMRDNAPPALKDSITALFNKANSVNKKIIEILDIYSSTLRSSIRNIRGFSEHDNALFSEQGDLIVPLISQTAGQSETLPHITKVTNADPEEVSHHGMLSADAVGTILDQLLNSSISSPIFSSSIPANDEFVDTFPLIFKPVIIKYDTLKVVTDKREEITDKELGDTSIQLKFRVKDTLNLQLVFINFQDSMYTTTDKDSIQQIMLKVTGTVDDVKTKELFLTGIYEKNDTIFYHTDTIKLKLKSFDSTQGFRVTVDTVQLRDGIEYFPSYEVKVQNKWQPFPSSDTSIKITLQDDDVLAYNNKKLAFNAVGDGESKAYFAYKKYKDTVLFDCLLPWQLSAVNRTISGGDFTNPAIWSKGRVPIPADSVIVSNGHTVVLDTSIQIRSLRIDLGGVLTINNTSLKLQLGDEEDGDFIIDNYGTLNLSNGTLTVNGRVKLNAGSHFNMTGGTLVIDGNTGFTINSLRNGLFLFEAQPAMQSFSFTGGTLQIIDPPIGVASQAISCPYNFGINSTLILGNGISETASNNPNGFGGNLFPAIIGRLILDAGTGEGNRVLTITKPINVKGSFEIKAGSNLILEAEMRVSQ